MRFATIMMVAVLLIIGSVAFADGHHEITTPSENPSMSPSNDQPSGSGPTENQPATTMTTPSTTMTTPPMTMSTTTAPPVSIMSTEVEAFNTNNCVSTFGVERNSVMQLRSSGWSWGDIYLMANIAQKSRRSILEIATMRGQNMSWSDISSHYNLTAMDITNPPIVVTRVAGYTAEYGYEPLYYRTDPWGNPVLTKYEAQRLSRMGYKWQDIAVATNISARTGARVQDVLAWTDRGYTWEQVSREYGLSPRRMMDISQYPFYRGEGGAAYTVPVTQPTTPVGSGPSMMPGSMDQQNMPSQDMAVPSTPATQPGPATTIPTY